jgi:2-iminobutanoate/2-iminopropanoate deaminase
MLQTISGTGIPHSSLPFSPAVKAGPFVFVSGQASVDGEGRIVEDTFAGEMNRSFNNVRIILEAAGLGLQHVVKVCSYVANQSDLEEYNAIYRQVFSPPYPARTTLIGCLGTRLKFEVDVVAFAEERPSASLGGERSDE